MTTPAEYALLALAALLGGLLNSVAGGGSFLTFPCLVLTGCAPLVANATSTVALWPGAVASAIGYRRELEGERSLVIQLAVVSALGGLLGALGVIGTPQRHFNALLPWLLLVASFVFTFGDALRRWLGSKGAASRALVIVLQFLVAAYGGYFGGGMGLMMLALFSLLGPAHLHAMNALKSVLGAAINATAVIAFVVAEKVDWQLAGVMTFAAVVGGYVGATHARRIQPALVKKVVVVLGWAMTVVFFLR